MQNAVVLQIVHEGGRREVLVRHEEHGCAGHAHRWLAFKAFEQALQLHAFTPQLGGQRLPAAHPGEHHGDDGTTDEQRHIAAMEQLGDVGGKERAFDHKDTAKQHCAQHQGPAQAFPEEHKGQDRVDHHGGVDRDAIGGGEVGGGAECHHQQDDADEDDPVDLADIDLAMGGLRCVRDVHARQQAQIDGLLRNGESTRDNGLAGNHRHHGGEDDERQDAPGGGKQEEGVHRGFRV